MSTQDRLGREGDSAHAEDGNDREGGSAVGGLDPTRMRAMHRRWVQRKASRAGGEGGGGGGAAAIPQAGGSALGGATQARMEKTLGADLSGVRVHTGGESAEAADSMGARAFTVGSDVHFNRGEFTPGSKEGDRLLAHELTHVVQGQKAGVQRKADHADSEGADGDHEAGGHEVSEPGDPAEHEADAVGDHAAEALHGGGDKAEGEGKEGGGKEAGGKKVGRQAGGDKPKIGEQSAGVSRKIFRAEKKGAPPPASASASSAKGAPAAAGGKDAGKDKAGAKAEPKPIPPNVVVRIQSINKLLDADVNERLAGVGVKSSQADIEQYSKDYADEASVKELKVKFEAKKAAIDARFQQVMTAATAAVTKIDASHPGKYAEIEALAKDPAIINWIDHPLFPAAHQLTQAFINARNAKMTEFGDNKKMALDKARGEIKAAPDKPESRALIEALFEAAKPYVSDKSPYHGAVVVQLQEAYVGKRESINAAEVAEKEKQEKLLKEQQEQQKAKQAQPEAGGGKDAAAGAPKDAAGGAPKPADAAKPGDKAAAPAAVAPPAEAKAAEVKPGDAKAGDAKPGEQKPAAPGQAKPDSASSASAGSAPAVSGAEKKQPPAAPPPPAPVTAEAPKPAGPPPQGDAKTAPPADAKAPEAKAPEGPKPAEAPAAEKKDAAAPAKPAEAEGGEKKAAPAGGEGPAKASGSESAAPAPVQAEDPKAKELQLKKDVAKARIHQYLAKIQGRSTIFSSAIEIANAGLTVLKAFGASSGIEIPEDALGMGKDGLQLMAKTHAFNAKLAAAMAEAEIDSAESVAEIDALFGVAEMLHEEHSILVSRAEALQKVCMNCFESRMKDAANGGGGASAKKGPEKKPGGAHGDEKKEGEEGAEGKEEGASLGETFSESMEQEDQMEQTDIGGFKMMANQAAVVLDPIKAIKAGLDVRVELKNMAQAKADVIAAEKALADHLAASGGTPLPGSEPKGKK